MSFVMSLDPDDFFSLIVKAKDETNRAWARDEWLARMPWMGKDEFVPFEEYYDRMKQPKVSQKPSKAILADVHAIRARRARKT